MKLERVIEVYRKDDDSHIGTYIVDLDATGILNILVDLVLNDDDFPEEIYDPYYLTENQIKSLLPFMECHPEIDFERNLYELMCYGIND